MNRISIISFLLFISFPVWSQLESVGYAESSKQTEASNKQKISWGEIFHQLSDSLSSKVEVKNKEIFFSEIDINLTVVDTAILNGNQVLFERNGLGGVRKDVVVFKNCIFPKDFVFKNWQCDYLEFRDCKMSDISIKDCEFETYFGISNSSANRIRLKDSKFAKYCKFKEVDASSIYVSSDFLSETIDTTSFDHMYRNIIYDLEFDEVNCVNLDINRCDFYTKNDAALLRVSLRLKNSEVEFLDLRNDSLKNILIERTSITNDLAITRTKIWDKFISSHFIFPENNTEFDWSLIDKGRLVIDPITPLDTLIKNLYTYNRMLALYSRFNSMYKKMGNLNSSNGSYVELKDIQTKRLSYVFKTDKSTENYLNWQLNVFLKFFAEYGTSPIRSLVVSFWVVLAFAVFYFFTRTDWDNINRKYLVKQSEQIMDYFTSEQKLEEFYSETYKEELVEYNEFKEKIAANSTQVPFFFMLFLKPLYYLSVVKHRLNSWLYKKMEILSGRWVDLPSKKKMIVGSLVAVASVSYLLYLFVVRSLNSIILSINTFSTLGFGDIPVRGFMRYVAIIEGFLGWFLLSIFSVSLISQIIQS